MALSSENLKNAQAGVAIELSLEESKESLVSHSCEVMIAKHVGIESFGRTADKWFA